MTDIQISKIVKGTFETELGKKCLDHLEATFVDRPIYKQGMTLQDAAYRQGQSDLVRQILKEANGN